MHAEDFASDVTCQYQLGEGSRFTKQPELAKQQYRNGLAIDRTTRCPVPAWVRLADDVAVPD